MDISISYKEVIKCLLCGKEPSRIYKHQPLTVVTYLCCGYSAVGVERWNRHAAAMELAKAVSPIMAYYDWLANDQESQNSNSSKPQTPPPPPPKPKKPELQYSTEDFKAPLPTRTQILTEYK